MSVSSLPEWKQLLLERKRREEEERERREKQEEEKFASMPAWKRGIIQRRKANELSLSPDPGLWLDAEQVSQVSVETIVPVHENPFIRTQSSWKKGRDAEVANEPEVKEREKEKSSPRGQDGEAGRGRDIELKIERFRDLSEGQEKEKSRDRSQGRERETSREGWEKDKSQWKDSVKDAGRERDFLKVKKDDEENETEIGKPLSRIESLREKIRQRELERLKQREAQDGGGTEGAEVNVAAEDGHDEGGTEIEKEWEAGAHMRKRLVEAERGQEDAAAQTSMTALDVTQEVGVLKTCPQLPVSVPHSQAVREEVTSGYATEKEQENPKMSPQRVCSPTSQLKQTNQTITITPSHLRSQSPDNTLKPAESAPTPACSPCSPSPSQSPSVSPSPTPSPVLFSIRSASGGKGKRGATITITPRKTAVGGAGQAQTTSTESEPVKKKFPTAEEIEVIGGYQNLEKSCLIKNRGTPKKVRRKQLILQTSETETTMAAPSSHFSAFCQPT
uniref:Phostensin/Taperin PP1-binding domain-containing protein n=1 Tax=Sparus aurata TaxID=8175 RepID=A0A671XD70_SPAAU